MDNAATQKKNTAVSEKAQGTRNLRNAGNNGSTSNGKNLPDFGEVSFVHEEPCGAGLIT